MGRAPRVVALTLGLLAVVTSVGRADGISLGFGFGGGRDDRREARCADGCGQVPCRGASGHDRYRPEGTLTPWGFQGHVEVHDGGFAPEDGFIVHVEPGRPHGRVIDQPRVWNDPALEGDGYTPPPVCEIDDKKQDEAKRVVKQGLVVGVGFDERDKAISAACVAETTLFLKDSWKFDRVTRLANETGTKQNILDSLKDLTGNVKFTNPKGLGAYYVVVHIQGHGAHASPARMKDLVAGVAVPKAPVNQLAFRAWDSKDVTSNKGFLFDFELFDRLNTLSAELRKLETNGAKTYLIVQMDLCWGEAFFDGWRGAKGAGKLPSNVYAAWSAGRDDKSEAITTTDGGGLTPFTAGFASGDATTSVQAAQDEASRRANDARKRDAEKTPVQEGKKPTTQNAGRAQGDGPSDVKPGQEKSGKPM